MAKKQPKLYAIQRPDGTLVWESFACTKSYAWDLWANEYEDEWRPLLGSDIAVMFATLGRRAGYRCVEVELRAKEK